MNDRSGFLPYGRQAIDSDDIDAVVEVLRSDTLTGGPVVGQFEAALAKDLNSPSVVVCATGTAALHLAVVCAGVRAGDTVIVPSLTFLASANAVRYAGADVVFADVDAESGLMTSEHFEDALNKAARKNVRAVIPVHLNGQLCDMPKIQKIAKSRSIKVIEDACHAIGGKYSDGSPVGSSEFSDFTCLSFHPVKTIAMGEGGAVATRDAKQAERMRILRNHGMERQPVAPTFPHQALSGQGESNPWYYEMRELGWNYRASDIHCALGLSQLKKLKMFVDRRVALVQMYDESIADLAPNVRPQRRPGSQTAWHLYVVHIDFEKLGRTRAQVMTKLKSLGVGSQVHYLPVHLQPYYANLYGPQTLPGAEMYYGSCLSLPLFPEMKNEDVDHVVDALRQATGA